MQGTVPTYYQNQYNVCVLLVSDIAASMWGRDVGMGHVTWGHGGHGTAGPRGGGESVPGREKVATHMLVKDWCGKPRNGGWSVRFQWMKRAVNCEVTTRVGEESYSGGSQ